MNSCSGSQQDYTEPQGDRPHAIVHDAVESGSQVNFGDFCVHAEELLLSIRVNDGIISIEHTFRAESFQVSRTRIYHNLYYES